MDAAPGRAPLPDISADEPTGENLEFDPAFAELERLAQGKPEQQYGSTVVPAEEPVWKDVAAAARALLERSHDLRVMALLCVARLHREGVPGYADALGMVRGLLETRWVPLHPQLDPEDDNDPTLRANALLAVAEPVRVLRVLRLLPLARSPRAGTVCWRDIAISQGTLEVEDAPRLSETVIGATFRDTDPAVLATLRLAIGEALDHSITIPGVFDHEAGHGTGPDFNDLTKLLREMAQMVDRYAVLPDAAPEPEAAPVAGEAAPAAAAPRAPQAVSIATLAPPTNRQDALRLLDLVIAYYTEHEPSSPLPMLVARARRMAEMNFMDILRDMAPDAVSQAEVVTGRPGDD